MDDTNPAMSSLTGPNQVVNGAATFTFSAAADPTLRLFECRVAGVHDWQTCSSGRQENPASSGTYTFEVRAVDWSGNRSGESTWQWTVDKIAPETSLASSGPSGTVASTSATFEFYSNESGTFSCTLDGVTRWAAAHRRRYSGLGQGQHTFTVPARDVAGNDDPTPATRTWTVDTVAPETTLASSGPTRLDRREQRREFTFSSEPGAIVHAASSTHSRSRTAAAHHARTRASRPASTPSRSGRATRPATRTPRPPRAPGR